MKQKIKSTRKTRILLIAVLVLIIGGFSWISYKGFFKPEKLRDLATITTNIPYCNTPSPAQTLDLYRPKNLGNDNLPLVVYIHGGGWRSGDKNGPLIATYAPTFIKKGVAVASIGYRLHSKTPYPDQNDDIACALTYLDTNATSLHIDTKKIIYFGESAGGQLAAFAALNIPYKNYDYEAPIGVIDFYGVSDFSKIIDGAHPDLNARRYLGSKYNKVTNSASPSAYVTKKAPRFLFVHGTDDKIVPLSQSKMLYDQLIKVGIDAEYVTVSGAKHGFIGPELSPPNSKVIQDNINLFLQETINR
jgi:acetyl esterase/lipase